MCLGFEAQSLNTSAIEAHPKGTIGIQTPPSIRARGLDGVVEKGTPPSGRVGEFLQWVLSRRSWSRSCASASASLLVVEVLIVKM